MLTSKSATAEPNEACSSRDRAQRTRKEDSSPGRKRLKRPDNSVRRSDAAVPKYRVTRPRSLPWVYLHRTPPLGVPSVATPGALTPAVRGTADQGAAPDGGRSAAF